MIKGKINLELQEQLPYYCNVANWGLYEVQEREGGGYTIALKKSFEAFLEQHPLTREIAELFVSMQATQAFRRQIVMAQCTDFKALADRLSNIQYRCMKLAAYVDAVQHGFIVVDEATDKVIAGVFPTLDELENWLDETEKIPPTDKD